MMVRTQLPLAYVCSGRKVSDDLEAGSLPKLVDLVFTTEEQDSGFIDAALRPAAGGIAGIQESPHHRSPFVANRNSDVYHAVDCKWSHKIKPDNIIHFSSPEEAEAQHFLPCRSCSPDQAKHRDTGAAGTTKRTLTKYR